VHLWRDNVINDADKSGASTWATCCAATRPAMPPVGKYNAGQKVVFWVMLLACWWCCWPPA
jgi:formate dehydrogenase subunit gamma